jgi:hypothetical protein
MRNALFSTFSGSGTLAISTGLITWNESDERALAEGYIHVDAENQDLAQLHLDSLPDNEKWSQQGHETVFIYTLC